LEARKKTKVATGGWWLTIKGFNTREWARLFPDQRQEYTLKGKPDDRDGKWRLVAPDKEFPRKGKQMSLFSESSLWSPRNS